VCMPPRLSGFFCFAKEYIHVYIHTHLYTHKYIHVYTYVLHTYIYVHIYMYICECVFVRMCCMLLIWKSFYADVL